MAARRPYHHGNLRAALTEAAVDAIARDGVAALSLREVARSVGVSHAAAAHHFGDRPGLLTAIAAEGFTSLADDLEAAAAEGTFGDVGVAYVGFATSHRGHFTVMFRPDLLRADDEELLAAKLRAAAVLFTCAEEYRDAAGGDAQDAGIAAWSLVHGLATLWLDGNLPPQLDDPVALADRLTPLLFQAHTRD